MNYLHFIKRSTVLAIVVLLFSACSDQPAPVKLVYPNKVNYESFIIANHLGYFKESDSPIEVITVNTGINAAEALTLGNADLAAMGDGPTVMLMAQKKNVAIITRYAKGERIHRMVADTSIHAPVDLLGKRIGVQVGSSTYGALISWLENHNIPADQITIVPMDPLNMPEAMKNRQLDAIAGSEPWPLNVEKMCQNSVHELDNLQNEKNHFPHVLLANTKIFSGKSEKGILSVLKALDKANEFIATNPDSSAKIAAQSIGLTEKEQKECLSRLIWELDWTPSDLNSLEETANFFLKSKKIAEKPDIAKYLHLMSAEK
jgi:ABC-type nitrate/sulfonate/bicarbonate transport system substrate-binding protein